VCCSCSVSQLQCVVVCFSCSVLQCVAVVCPPLVWSAFITPLQAQRRSPYGYIRHEWYSVSHELSESDPHMIPSEAQILCYIHMWYSTSYSLCVTSTYDTEWVTNSVLNTRMIFDDAMSDTQWEMVCKQSDPHAILDELRTMPQTQMCINVLMYVDIYVCTAVYVCTYIYLYLYLHMYIHMTQWVMVPNHSDPHTIVRNSSSVMCRW